MYSGQGNYTSQFRQGPPGPLPPYLQAPPVPPPFVQPPTGPSFPPAPHGPPVHQLGQQASPFFGRLAAPQAQQPVHFPRPPVNSSQYLQQLPLPPPPPPPQANVSATVVPPYPLSGFSLPVPVPNSNAHPGMQQLPHPRIPPPTPQPHSQPQGQVLFHSSHPPHPGMLHAPPVPPWPINVSTPPPPAPPPCLDLKIRASFTGQHPIREIHPPSIPPTPPPPPPPPPSSPPPLPPSPPAPIPASEDLPIHSPEDFTTNSNIDSTCQNLDNAPVHIGDASRGPIEGKCNPEVDGEASEDLALPPPRPDEAVVRNIEVLCQFIAKVGPHFESTARANEAGNPKFDFLFGGEPGSCAAIGHEYFQWMKKKYITKREPSKGLKHNASTISTTKADILSEPENLGRLNMSLSPATSDMDMEDDISPVDIDKGFINANKESSVSANARPHSSDNVKDNLQHEFCLVRGASSPVKFLMDVEDVESSFFEDVSPDRGSPDTAGLGDGIHASSRLPSRDSINAKVSPNKKDSKSQEASGVYLKYGSPFRLIQDYASDESDNENVRSGNEEDANPVCSQGTTSGTSSLQPEKEPESCLNFGSQGLSTFGNGSGYHTTIYQISPSRPQEAGKSPEKSVPSTSNFDAVVENVDPDNYQIENMLNDRRETSRLSPEYGASEGRKMVSDQETEKLHSKENLTDQNVSHDVDEFGRLVRKGASGSDSDRSPDGEKHAKRGRSRSKSLSRSPRGSRRRRRSISPRRRDNRSRSRSWSPKRRRSKSPQSFRSNMVTRRGRDLPPDCFNFIRGRCFYGASCRFLHRDSGHLNMQQRYQDSRKPRYLHSSDNSSLSRISYHDKTELHSEKCNKLEEADDDTISPSFIGNVDGKDEQVQTTEAEDASILVSREISPEVVDATHLVSQEVIPEAEDASILASGKMTPEADDASNLVSQEMMPEAVVGGSPMSQEIIRPEQESPVEVPFTSVDGETNQPISDSFEPLPDVSLLVGSPTGKSASSPHHDDFEQPSSGDIFSCKLSQPDTITCGLEVEKSTQHVLPVQASQSTPLPVQASTSPVNVGEKIIVEETANLNIIMYSHSATSTEPSVLPLHKEFSAHNLLMSGSNLPLPPPPSSHGQHALPLPPPPPAHGLRPISIPNDSLGGLFPGQHFRENILPPMRSQQSQLSAEPYMFYPQRPPLPSNLQSNEPNLPWSDQHMLPLLNRPPFPSSESSQMHHQSNSVTSRNDFMPLVRPYPSGKVPASRPSDFYSQAFVSVPSVHPPGHLSFSIEQGGVHVQNQGLMTPSSSMPQLRSFQGDRVDPRSYPREEFSTPHLRGIGQPLYNQPNAATFGMTTAMLPSIQRYTENSFQPHPTDVSVPRFPIREHYNPYASAFEQPQGADSSIPVPQIRRYDPSLSAYNVSFAGIGFGMRASPRSSRRLGEQVPRTGNYVQESSAEMVPDAKKQFVQEPVSGAPYDPLFDSIEPFSGTSKVRVEEQNSGVNDTSSASKRRATKVVGKKNKGGVATEMKAEVDELGEIATDADAGGVENESPQLLDDKDWSPLIPFDVAETNVGEIEINQVRSPSKSKKSKDSRSMKLFKVAVADFAKEVLKPSWRQGNLSKEAFKTIVKKTVDKVAGAVPSHQVPKSQAKINQYVDSSQRKLTKLVMGYVDKYIKM